LRAKANANPCLFLVRNFQVAPRNNQDIAMPGARHTLFTRGADSLLGALDFLFDVGGDALLFELLTQERLFAP